MARKAKTPNADEPVVKDEVVTNEPVVNDSITETEPVVAESDVDLDAVLEATDTTHGTGIQAYMRDKIKNATKRH